MRSTEYEARWNVIRPQYGDCLPNYAGQRKEVGNSINSARLPRGPVRVVEAQEQQPVIRKMPSTNERKEPTMTSVEQTKIISALKSELSSLKTQVTKLITTDKQFSKTQPIHSSQVSQNSHTTCQSDAYPPRPPQPPKPHFISPHACTVQRKPSIHADQNRECRASDLQPPRQVLSDTQLKQQMRFSDVGRRRQVIKAEPIRQVEVNRQPTQNEKLAISKQSSERQLNNIIDALRRQQAEAEQHYVKRIQELESGLKEFETKITAKDSELAMIKQEIYHSRVNKKDDERQAKLIDALQETNRTLTSQVLDLQEKLRQEQRKTALAEQIKNSSSNEIKRLSDEITLLREQANRLTEEVNKAREDRDRKVREKTKEIQQVTIQKDRLVVSNSDLLKELQKERQLAKAELSKSTPITIANNMQQIKKQELDSLLSKIEVLRKDKKSMQHDIKGLIQTKQAFQHSLNILPKNKTIQELKLELTQKQQTVTNLLADIKNLQADLAKNRHLGQKLKANQTIVHELNDTLMKRELSTLNKRYL